MGYYCGFLGVPQQIPPVVCHGNHCKIVQAYIHASSLCGEIQQLNLTINMRLKPDEVIFAKYLLQLGHGTTPMHPEIDEDMVKIPLQHLVSSTDELIDKVFPQLGNIYMDKSFISQRAILTPLNDNVDKINEVIMEKFPGKVKPISLLTVLLMKIWPTHIQLIS